MGFLDYTGLARFKQKLDVLFAGKLDTSLKGAANGLAELDSTGKVVSSQLPDIGSVIEVASYSNLPATGAEHTIYITTDTNESYRWDTNHYDKIANPNDMVGASGSLAGASGLVPAPSAGDHEKFLKGDGTWANAGETVYANTIDMSSSDSTKISEAIAEKVDKVTGKGLSTNDYTTADQTAVQTTLPNRITAIETAKGANGGYAELDSSGKVPTSQLPSYVDDVEEYPTLNDFPATGESGKIYVATSTNITYRWGGSEYVPIGSDLALGETSSTAYRGDRGKAAYDHATAKGSAYANGFYKITTNSEGHVTSASAVQKSDITDLGIPGSHQDISGKADKVSNATSGNFAGLDANGNLTDSGSKASDFLTQHQDISGKADKVSNATSGNFAGLDVNGNLTDSGHSGDNYLEKVYDAEYADLKFENKFWGATISYLTGTYIWSDGENIYYSNGSAQYVLDKSTSTWENKVWNGLTNFYGSLVWSDGDAIYYSNSSSQYVLDKSTSTWSTKAWYGLTNFSGLYIWIDGDNIYYSNSSIQYALDKSTSTWSQKTWSGLISFDREYIWSDGENVYYSNEAAYQYVLDKTISKWNQKTWNGFTAINGNGVWSDGENIYHSFSSSQHVLDKSTFTWNPKTWSGLTNFNGKYIWSDGENVYYSYNKAQYVLAHNKDQVLIGKEGQWERVSVDEFVMGGSTSSSAGASGLVPTPAAGDNVKYLMGNGTWEVAPGARIVQVITTVTNTSGAYTDTIQDARVSADMKAIGLEIANPYVFNDKITVTCNAGSVTFSCNDVTGTSIVKINIIKADTNTTIMTSEEFDVLNAAKVDKNQGIANAGKALGINAQGMVEPVPFSGEDFTGATSSTAGTHGYVPAPAAGDQNKFLKGNGTWASTPVSPQMAGATATTPGLSGLVPAPAAGAQDKVLTGAGTWVTPVGSRVLVVNLDNVTNTSGSYTHTTTVTGMTSDLKAVAIECSDPTIFKGKVTVTTGTDSVTLTCSDVAGSSTVKVSFLAIGNANPLSSTEYGALDTRIGQLSDLDTTDKSSVVDAINEVNGNLADNLGGTENMFKFATDGNGKYGYVKKVSGADTFVPFKDSIVGCTFLGYGLADPSAASSTFTNLSGKEDCYLFLAARSTSSGYVNLRANVTSSSGCTLTLIEKTTQMQIGSNYLATALYKMSNLTSSVNITTGKDAYATAEKYIIQMPLG